MDDADLERLRTVVRQTQGDVVALRSLCAVLVAAIAAQERADGHESLKAAIAEKAQDGLHKEMAAVHGPNAEEVRGRALACLDHLLTAYRLPRADG